MKTYYWIIIGIVVLLLLAVGVLWYFDNTKIDKTPPSITKMITPATSSAEDNGSSNAEIEIETIQLKAVGNYKGMGSATRIFQDGKFTHTVTTTLGNPELGKFYEGWLVNMSKTPPFFSTGPVENIDGVYELTYEANMDYPGYTMVVITEETSANGFDGVPEDHVLEGLF